jgi:hypothetical protein
VVNVGDVKTGIEQGIRSAQEAAYRVEEVRAEILESSQAASAVTHDSRHDKVQLGLSRLRDAHTEAGRVTSLLRSGSEAARAFLGDLG